MAIPHPLLKLRSIHSFSVGFFFFFLPCTNIPRPEPIWRNKHQNAVPMPTEELRRYRLQWPWDPVQHHSSLLWWRGLGAQHHAQGVRARVPRQLHPGTRAASEFLLLQLTHGQQKPAAALRPRVQRAAFQQVSFAQSRAGGLPAAPVWQEDALPVPKPP